MTAPEPRLRVIALRVRTCYNICIVLKRYYRDDKGKPSIRALIYEKSDHCIDRSAIDRDAVKICSRLNSRGFEAYIVGGAVRDLLLNRTPKDFDIATSASPNQVKKLFRNSRIIGKRFRLVHIYFHDGKIHEVATFRAPESGDRNHVYGTFYQDVTRRDFSLNALYYSPSEEVIIDFVGGVEDIRRRIVRSVLPLDTSFTEDPVRMLRAVKYAAITGMRIAPQVGRKIRKQAPLLASASVSRLSEELHKILKSGNSEVIMRLMHRYHLLQPLLPRIEEILLSGGEKLREAFFLSLAEMDQQMLTAELSRGRMLQFLTAPVMEATGVWKVPELEVSDLQVPDYFNVVQELKNLLKPLVQPNRDVEEAVKWMFRERGLKMPRKRSRFAEENRSGRNSRPHYRHARKFRENG
ncbi:MAG: hypothetical protein CSA76_05765 [Spirochaetales bacterium]|nr:MAG: hypothetical protein CSA76_05765 [Spirochaetales bacterium]